MDSEYKELLEKQLKFINLLLEFRQVSKLLNGFLEKFDSYIDSDGRIRSSFNNTVCVTGRLSSSSPNVEQLPKESKFANIRNLFISDTDNVLIVADYSGQELRILGEESNDKNLREAFEKGLDLHLDTANRINKLGLSGLQLVDETPEHDEAKTLYKKERDDAKCVNFGIPYGKQAYGFSIDFHCSEKEAQVFIDKYFEAYPQVKLRIERCNMQVYTKGYVTNMSGRRRRFPGFHSMWNGKQKRCYRQAFNFLIQSYGADVVKKACIDIIKDTNLKIVNIVHDEVVVECCKSYVEQGMEYIRKCMLGSLPMSIPWNITIDHGTVYGDCK